MGYRIGSFNIQKFSRLSVFHADERESKKDLDALANIIRENSFDIIAIQEIFHPLALKELLEKISGQYADQLKRGSIDLGSNNIGSRTNESFGYRTKHWEGRWAKPKSNYGDRIAEGYAFIWNRDRVKLVTNMKGESFEPRIVDFGKVNDLVRPPMIGRFMPINSRYEFRIINTHIVYSSPSKKYEADSKEESEFEYVDENDVVLRRKEFDILVRSIYVEYNDMMFDKTGHDKNARLLVPYTFLLGDYNLNLRSAKGQSSANFGIGMESIFLKSKDDMCIITVNDKLTTLRGKVRNEERQKLLDVDPIIEHHLANNYDHVTFDCNKFRNHQIAQPKEGVIYAFDIYENSNEETKYDIYKRRISDHVPIYIDIDIRKKMF